MARGTSRYGDWPKYVPVAERRRQAEREVAKLRKQGRPVAPVVIAGRGAIAGTFWGKAWCDTLESYHDYENRLPRGRSYVRNGSVIDLQIAPLEVTALVSGSSIYKVGISIKAAPKPQWQSLCRDCAGAIDSLVELLQGRLSSAVMERLCRQDNGLFPKPSEIRFSCSCPDSASMCKHVAAVLYGIGSRLDDSPELLFRLRGVDAADLIANLKADSPLSKSAATGNVLQDEDLSALFGLEMADGEGAVEAKPAARQKGTARLKQVDPQTTRSGEISAKKKPLRDSKMPASAPKPIKSAARKKSDLELTPDGFVKWWK
jgi:uncharacterized Zn finger protein